MDCVNAVTGVLVVLGELHVVRIVPVFVCDAVVRLIHFVLKAVYRSHCFHVKFPLPFFCIWRYSVYTPRQ